jgi:hypothetical protein
MLEIAQLQLKDTVIVSMDESEVKEFAIIRSINEETGEVICQGVQSVRIKTSIDANGDHWGRVTKISPEDNINDGTLVLVDGVESLVIEKYPDIQNGLFRHSPFKVIILPLSSVRYYHVNIKDLDDKWKLAFK